MNYESYETNIIILQLSLVMKNLYRCRMVATVMGSFTPSEIIRTYHCSKMGVLDVICRLKITMTFRKLTIPEQCKQSTK